MSNQSNRAPGWNRRNFLAATAALSAVPLLGATDASTTTKMQRLLGIDPRYSGKGQTFDVGVLTALTGSGAIYGSHGTDIFKLVARDIETLGGPTLNMIYKDNKSGDPQAGVQAMRELGAAKVPMMLSTYSADLGAALPGINEYKIFSVDGTGGTSQYAMGKPYFWGAIAITPDDAFPGALKYVAAKMPQVKTYAVVGWDLGPLSDIVAKDLQKDVGTSMKLVADERTKVGTTDYSASIQKVKAANPDIIFLPVYAEDVGYFMKQYATSGINKPVLAFAHSQAAATIAGPAYEGLYFAFDYFDAAHPGNPYGDYFVDSFKGVEGGLLPEFYVANIYEDTFVLWECIRRVLKSGGNARDGVQLDAALRANPVFPSVYGGDNEKPGVLAFDLTTHSVKKRPMRVLQFKGGKIVTLAYFNIDGADFRLA
jgi:branched-chain amino acid transport system substrate-binding protein